MIFLVIYLVGYVISVRRIARSWYCDGYFLDPVQPGRAGNAIWGALFFSLIWPYLVVVVPLIKSWYWYRDREHGGTPRWLRRIFIGKECK